MSATPPERLPAALEASALIRRAQAQGGFGTIIRKGDPDRGSLLLVVRGPGRHVACLERLLGPDGGYGWQAAGPGESASDADLADFLERRRRFDEDSWIVELDIAQPERFIAETTASP